MTLQEFIEGYRAQHGDMSLREFAKQVGVSPSTIMRWVDPEAPEKPDMVSLIKLSKATATDLLTLVEIAYPEEVHNIQIDPSAKVFASKVARLPGFIRDAIYHLVDSYLK